MPHAPFRRTDPFSAQWANEPEPSVPELDPQTILNTDLATSDAYLWNTHNNQEAWLQYKGELQDIEK